MAQLDLEQPVPRSTPGPEDETLLCILSAYTRQPHPTFTCENQQRLLRHILRGKHSNILAVLPTGAGKSIAIFGPPLVESTGVSIVITPYTALRRQLAQQAKSFGIRFLVWNERNAIGSPSPVSVQLVIMITDDLFGEEAQRSVHFSRSLQPSLNHT